MGAFSRSPRVGNDGFGELITGEAFRSGVSTTLFPFRPLTPA